VRRSVTAQRVLSDVGVLARAGLDGREFVTEALQSVARAVPHVGACVAHLDPSTLLHTRSYRLGDLDGRDSHDREWAVLEFSSGDPTAMRALALRGDPAVGMRRWNATESVGTPRVGDFLVPYFGYTDELRVVLRDGGRVWGGLSLFRCSPESPFDVDDLELMAALSPLFAVGLRGGLLTEAAAPESDARHDDAGPAVIVVDPAGRIRQISSGAERRLADLLPADPGRPAGPLPGGHADPGGPAEGHACPGGPAGEDVRVRGSVAGVVAAARRYAAGEQEHPARSRIRGPGGQWLVLHASTLAHRDGSAGDVVVTIEEARPPEIVPLVVAAFDLTPRERDVTLLVLQGMDTREIAARLHLSSYTVQDHLKAVFDKAGVRSRRELIARVYFDQYVPRMGGALAPSGWFG
jgi:DNA-binding CsgD family transcriptional regulator